MDRTEEDMQHLGFFTIITQSFKLISKNLKIFTQITLTLILPLTLIFIAHSQISRHIFYKIETNSLVVSYDDTVRYRHVSVTDWIYYWLFKIVYFTLLTVFSLLSTAAIVFTIASVYTSREVNFRHVCKIVPRVWKKLFLTFVYIYMALFLYNVMYGVIVVLSRLLFGYSTFGLLVMLVLLCLYVYGFLYLSVVWQLASVVTVLEDLNGLNAMKKGKILLYGKKKAGMGLAFVMYFLLLGLMVVLELFVEYGDQLADLRVIWRVLIGMVCGLVLLIWFLLFIVMQTVLYLVCKSFHREAIDKLSLSTFLGAYAGETVVLPSAGEEIQLGRARGSV